MKLLFKVRIKNEVGIFCGWAERARAPPFTKIKRHRNNEAKYKLKWENPKKISKIYSPDKQAVRTINL